MCLNKAVRCLKDFLLDNVRIFLEICDLILQQLLVSYLLTLAVFINPR